MRIARGGPRSTRKGRPNPRRPSRLSTNERTNERTRSRVVTAADPPRSSLWSPSVPGVFALEGYIWVPLRKWHPAGSDVQQTWCSYTRWRRWCGRRSPGTWRRSGTWSAERTMRSASKHSAELERLRERVCVAALGVRGADEVRHRSRHSRHPSLAFADTHVTSPRSPRPAGIRQGPRAEPPREDQDGHRRVRRGVGRAQRRQQAARDGTRRRGASAPRRPARDARDGPAARATRPGGEDLLAEQRVRAARLEREIREIERRGERGGDANHAAAVGGATIEWLDVATRHGTPDAMDARETARVAPGMLPTPAPTPPTRPAAAPPAARRRARPRAPPARPGAVAAFLVATGTRRPSSRRAPGFPRRSARERPWR